jgi:Sporulation and spore germination
MRRPPLGPEPVFGMSPRQRVFWPWLTLLFVSGAVIVGIVWEVWPRTVDLSRLRPRVQGPQAPSSPATERFRVRLFFPHDVRAILMEVERELPRRSVLVDAVRAVLQELARTDSPGTDAALPSTVEVRQVFVDAFGILYVDLNSKGIEPLMAGDKHRAALSLSAVVLTLTTNFSEVKRVQFLADGREWVAQIGTMDLRRPLQPHFPEEESSTIISKPAEDEP